MSRLERDLARTQSAVAALRDLLANPQADAQPVIGRRRAEATPAASITETVASMVAAPVELATIIHPGPHHGIDRAYGALGAYVAEHALAVGGPIREYYLVGRHETADTAEWRTEVCWPTFHTGPGSAQAEAS